MNLVAQPVETELGVTGASGLETGPGGGPPGVPGPGGGNNPSLPGGPNNSLPTTGTPPPVGGPPGQQFTSTNPLNPTPPTGPNVGQNLLRAPLNPVLMGDAALMTAGGGGAGTGAGQGDRTVRGGLNPASGKGVTPGRAVTIGSVPDDEARAARNAEKIGARTGRPGSSLMQPAATGGRSDGEDDKEHVRRYGIDSGDVFEDQRVVAPESIGDEPDDH